MMELNFRSLAKILANYIDEPHTMIQATDAILTAFPQSTPILKNDAAVGLKSPDGTAHWNGERWVYSHSLLVERARYNTTIMEIVKSGRKIQAIKHLRDMTYCGLKEAKEAIEDPKVWTLYTEQTDEALQALRDKLAYNPPTQDDPWNNAR